MATSATTTRRSIVGLVLLAILILTLLVLNEAQSLTAFSPPPPPGKTGRMVSVAQSTTTRTKDAWPRVYSKSPPLLLVATAEISIHLDQKSDEQQQASPTMYHHLRDDVLVANEEKEVISRRLFLGTIVATGVLAATTTNDSAQAKDIASEISNGGGTVVSSSSTILSVSTSTAAAPVVPIDWNGIFQKASKKALGGGKAGAAAAVVQVSSLMWLRTSMNYQYRYGGNLTSSLSTLYQEGGIPRLYQGLPFALLQGPLTRFGDTAANVGILVLLDSLEATRDWPLPLKTVCGSLAAGLWRIILMPIDASKTALQVQGPLGLERLWQEVTTPGGAGIGALYRGAWAQAAATAAGHYPWFLTYNALNANLPPVSAESDLLLSLARSALLGLVASCVSDCVSNSLRVIKTTKQTAQLGMIKDNDPTAEAGGDGPRKSKELSYPEVVAMIIEEDGVAGLFGRGLQTRLLTNAIQGALFSVLWRYFQEVGFMQ